MPRAGHRPTGSAGAAPGPIPRAISRCATPMAASRCTAAATMSSTFRATVMGTEEIEGAILRDKALDPDSPVGNVHRRRRAAPREGPDAAGLRRAGRRAQADAGRPAPPGRSGAHRKGRGGGAHRLHRGRASSPRRAAANTCGAWCARWSRAATSATSRRCAIPKPSTSCAAIIDDWQRASSYRHAAAVRALPLFPVQYNHGRDRASARGDGHRHQPAGQCAERARDRRAGDRGRASGAQATTSSRWCSPGRARRQLRGGRRYPRRCSKKSTRSTRRMVLPNNAQLAFRKIETHGQAVHRRDPGRGAGRRHGVRARLPLPDRRADRALRPARNQAAAAAGLWRHAAPAAPAG